MKILFSLWIVIAFLLPKPFFKSFHKNKWKLVSSASTLSPKEHLVKNEYYLTFTKNRWLTDFRIDNSVKKENQKYFDDYIEWYFARKKRSNNNTYKISTCIRNKDKMIYYKILKDTNLVKLNHNVFFQQSHGTMKIVNDTLILDLKYSSDSPNDWLIWKFVKQ